MPKARCAGGACPPWSRNGEHPATSADGVLVRGWWISGRGAAALAECRSEGARGPVTISVAVGEDASVTVECSQGPWMAHIHLDVLAEINRRRKLRN